MQRPVASQSVPARARLNPFVFPSTTDTRFGLLIIAVVSASAVVYTVLLAYSGMTPLSSEFQAAWQRCSALSLDAANADAVDRCLQPTFQLQAAGVALSIGAMLLVAVMLFLAVPAWKMRRARLVAFTSQDSADVWDCLQELCEQAGLKARPTFVWNPLNVNPGGLAFGRPGRHFVAISGGLVVLFSIDRPAFQAVVLHELAHIRNGDVEKTYFAIALWWAFVGAALAPLLFVRGGYLMLLLLQGSPAAAGHQLLIEWTWVGRVAALALVVYLLRNAVLRAREVYADLRASALGDVRTALDHLLQGTRIHRRRWPLRLFTLHPDPSARRLLLQDTDQLFGLDRWEAFGCGCCAGIGYGGVALLIARAQPLWLWFLSDVLSGVIFGGLVVGVAGIGVWRFVLCDLARRQPVRATSTAAAAIGLGLVLGLNLGLEVTLIDSGYHVLGVGFSAADLAWDAIMLLTCLLLIGWLRSVARHWLTAVLDLASPRLPFVIGLTTTALLIGGWFSVLTMLSRLDPGTIGPALEQNGLSSRGAELYLGAAGLAVTFLAESPLTLCTIVVVVAFPLSASLLRRWAPSGDSAAWLYLDRPAPRMTAPPLSLRPLSAVRVGLLCGVGYLCLSAYALLTVLIGGGVHSYALIVVAVNASEALPFVAQIVAAIVAYLRAPDARVPHALLAVLATSALIPIGFVPIHVLVGLLDPSIPTALHTAMVLTNLGAIGALLAVIPVQLLRLVLQRRGAPAPLAAVDSA